MGGAVLASSFSRTTFTARPGAPPAGLLFRQSDAAHDRHGATHRRIRAGHLTAAHRGGDAEGATRGVAWGERHRHARAVRASGQHSADGTARTGRHPRPCQRGRGLDHRRANVSCRHQIVAGGPNPRSLDACRRGSRTGWKAARCRQQHQSDAATLEHRHRGSRISGATVTKSRRTSVLVEPLRLQPSSAWIDWSDRARSSIAVAGDARMESIFGGRIPITYPAAQRRFDHRCRGPHDHDGVECAAPKLVACGDYVAGLYPATLERAVRSGIEAVFLLETP